MGLARQRAAIFSTSPISVKAPAQLASRSRSSQIAKEDQYTSKEHKGLLPPLEARLEKGLLPALKKCHKENTQGPHWYVAVMAVDPSAQGAKHCSRLMRAVCAQADADGIPAYLDCSGPRNKTIYERFGFRCVNTYKLEVTDGDEEGWPSYEPFIR